MPVPNRDVTTAPYGSITATPGRVLNRLGITVFRSGPGTVRGFSKQRSTIRGRRGR